MATGTRARWIEKRIAATSGVVVYYLYRLLHIFSLSLFLGSLALSSVTHAQAQTVSDEHRSLASVLQNINASRALLLATLEDIGTTAATETARNSLQRQWEMEATMSAQDMMAAGHNMAQMTDTTSHTTGPFEQLEESLRTEILAVLDSADAAIRTAQLEQAVDKVNSISERILPIFEHGAQLRAKVVDIYADDTVTDKQQAVDAAVQWYLIPNDFSVPSVPKNAELALKHRHANSFGRAFPKLTALTWSNRWIELAAIEAMMLEYLDTQLTDGVDIALARYSSKINTDSPADPGIATDSPVPTERPTAPAIAPQLYNAHPEVAIILDNLNMFEAVLLDVFAYPNLADRQSLIEAAADEFTNAETNLSENLDYIVSALRGGIYFQGGPAAGQLSQSERNRSRGNMEMEHDTPKPTSTMRID